MAGVFDKETLLDLIVNVIPLVIILFFVVAFAVVDPFGGDRLGRILQFGLLIVPFLALALLTYISGKVIAADERRADVYHQGQATMAEVDPRHGDESSAGAAGDASTAESDAAAEDTTTEAVEPVTDAEAESDTETSDPMTDAGGGSDTDAGEPATETAGERVDTDADGESDGDDENETASGDETSGDADEEAAPDTQDD